MLDFLDFMWTFDFYVPAEKISLLAWWTKALFILVFIRVLVSNVFALKHRLTVYSKIAKNSPNSRYWNYDKQAENPTFSFFGLLFFGVLYTLKSSIVFFLVIFINSQINKVGGIGVATVCAILWYVLFIIANVIVSEPSWRPNDSLYNYYWGWTGIDQEIFKALYKYKDMNFLYFKRLAFEKKILTAQNKYYHG